METNTQGITARQEKAIISLRSVSKVYRTGSGDFTALKDISLDIYPAEFLGIVGKSGAGKTTLLNMISGVSQITAGEVLFYSPDGQGKSLAIDHMNQDQLAQWRAHNMGIVYQSFELMPQLDLVNNIMLPQEFAGQFRPGVSRGRALELLDIVELSEHAYKLPAHISGGQKQRVAIARALVNDPHLIVADEPTGSLDSVTSEVIFEIFAKLVDQGRTVVMVTHDMDLAERFSRRLIISDGVLVENIDEEPAREEAAPAVIEMPDETGQDEDGETGEPLLARINTNGNHGRTEPAILLQDVVKTYVNAAGSFTALKGIDLQIDYGQFVALVGKSGSGKSTLLNMLTGIDHPTSGLVRIGGERIYEMSESRRALWRGHNVGIVFQFFQLLPTLTLLENTILPMDYCNVYPYQERPDRALALLEMVGLAEHAYDLPSNVSNGQQQAAAIARSLATDPPIIVADEPTGNLDTRSAEVVIRVFQELAARGKTILIVTHDPSLTRRTDRTVIISDGELIDPIVAGTLPSLEHPQMLQATHAMERRVYPAREVIVREGEPVHHLYMVGRGAIEVLDGSSAEPVARLSRNAFFGEVELMGRQEAIATVRAGDSPVEVGLLPRAHFQQIMEESPATVALIEDVATARRAENAARGRAEVAA